MFDVVRPVAEVNQAGNYIQPNLGHGLRIWWAFYWPAFLATAVLVIAFNVALRFVLQIPTLPFALSRVIIFTARYAVYILYYVVAFFVIAYVLRKNFRDFRIGLLSNHGGDGAQLLPPTFSRTARVWWTFSWRTLVYRIIALVAAWVALGFLRGFLAAVLPGAISEALTNGVVQIVIDGVVGAFVIYSNILDEDISDFRVALWPRPAVAPTAAADAVLPGPMSK